MWHHPLVRRATVSRTVPAGHQVVDALLQLEDEKRNDGLAVVGGRTESLADGTRRITVFVRGEAGRVCDNKSI